jgi:uncharacterized RDD family membrane protein YckC
MYTSSVPSPYFDGTLRKAAATMGMTTLRAEGIARSNVCNHSRCHVRRGTRALSTAASQLELAPAWKQEVNKRIAAHMRRKGGLAEAPHAPEEVRPETSVLAAQAAARVAARYAKAPRYSDVLAGEARAAVRAAEAASRAALEAQAAAEFVLAGLESGSVVEKPHALESFDGGSERATGWSWDTSGPAPAAEESMGRKPFEIRWEPDLPPHAAPPATMRATHGAPGAGEFAAGAENWWEASATARDAHHFSDEGDAAEVVEPAQPLPANLIEFPRELVATRKIRPRLAEGPLAAASEVPGQLSIFEVDPGSISTEPVASEIVTVPASEWTSPDWAGIKLGEEPGLDIDLGDDPLPAARTMEPASINLRMMAAVVDCSLMAGAFLGAAMVAMDKATDLPPLKEIEPSAILGLLAIIVVYQLFFFTLGSATPGMRWAHISLHTLKDERPTRGQRWVRLLSLLLSLLPLGLGLAWSIFDENRLSWHDRLSRTYMKKS